MFANNILEVLLNRKCLEIHTNFVSLNVIQSEICHAHSKICRLKNLFTLLLIYFNRKGSESQLVLYDTITSTTQEMGFVPFRNYVSLILSR